MFPDWFLMNDNNNNNNVIITIPLITKLMVINNDTNTQHYLIRILTESIDTFLLNNNTDAEITKIVAGSFILVMVALLVVGLVIPSITDYGDGVCSPIQNGGRC
jgi:hypothetical protein